MLTAGTFALWIGAAFALGAAAASVTSAGQDDRAVVAHRSLVMSASFTLVAGGMLLAALARADLSVDFVARHITLSLPAASRLLSVFSDASGAGLATAAAVGLVGLWPSRDIPSPARTGVLAVTMLVLLAAALAGGPLAAVPGVPVDGLGVSPLFRQPLAVAYVLTAMAAVACAALALAAVLGPAWTDANVHDPGVTVLLALVFTMCQALVHVHASALSGIATALTAERARGGAWLLTVAIVAASCVVARSCRSSRQARLESCLAVLLATVGLVLAAGGEASPAMSVRALWVVALVLLLVAVWRTRAGVAPGEGAKGRVRAMPVRRALLIGALAAAGIAAVMSSLSRTREPTLASGAVLDIGLGAQLAHQGISTYEEPQAFVVALALEYRRPGHVAFARAEQKEFIDARGSVVGAVARMPAVFHGVLGSRAVWLEGVEPGDRARLRVTFVPGYWLWWLSLALVVLAALAEWVPAPPRAAPR